MSTQCHLLAWVAFDAVSNQLAVKSAGFYSEGPGQITVMGKSTPLELMVVEGIDYHAAHERMRDACRHHLSIEAHSVRARIYKMALEQDGERTRHAGVRSR